MFMHHNSTLPPQIKKIFTINNTVHHHNTRHSTDPHIPQHSYHMVVSSFIIYIKLEKYGTESSKNIKESQTIKSFNKKLKMHISVIIPECVLRVCLLLSWWKQIGGFHFRYFYSYNNEQSNGQ